MARWPYAWRSKALPTQVCSRVLPTDPGSEEYQPRKPVPSHDNSRCLFLSAPSFPAAGQASPPWQPSWITASLTSPLGKVGNIKINFFFFFPTASVWSQIPRSVSPLVTPPAPLQRLGREAGIAVAFAGSQLCPTWRAAPCFCLLLPRLPGHGRILMKKAEYQVCAVKNVYESLKLTSCREPDFYTS